MVHNVFARRILPMGAYHGIEGFRAMSHAKGVFEQGRWALPSLLRAPFGRLAELAAGRMLKEEAVLAAEPQTGGLFLWQAEDANASAHNLLRLFETFVNSCDWWRERVASVSDERLQFGPDEMIMRP